MKKLLTVILFTVLFTCKGYCQIADYIYAINNMSSTIYFSKIEISTGTITNLNQVPLSSLSTSYSSCIDNSGQKYFFCDESSIITFDPTDGSILSNVNLPIAQDARLTYIQFNPCDGNIYGILNYAGLSFVRYNPLTEAVTVISALDATYLSSGPSIIDPDSNLFIFENHANIIGIDISTGEEVFTTPIQHIIGEEFGHIDLKCSTHEIFGTSANGNEMAKYLSVIDPRTGQVSHVSESSWTPGYSKPSGGGNCINQFTGDFYYSGSGGVLIGANTETGTMIYNETINSFNLYYIRHFSQCSCITSGDEDVENKDYFTLYPNPATTQITITGYTPAYLKLCNTLGQTVAEASNTTTLLLGSLPQGLYVLQLFDAKGGLVKAEKVVKE